MSNCGSMTEQQTKDGVAYIRENNDFSGEVVLNTFGGEEDAYVSAERGRRVDSVDLPSGWRAERVMVGKNGMLMKFYNDD